MILGIDEVGRGPWAGPLVVGAVVLGDCSIVGLTDSKKLSKAKRELLSALIQTEAAAVSLGWVSSQELDDIGMSEALNLACIRAVQEIKIPYHEIIIDGTINMLKNTNKGKYVTLLKKADLLIPEVSAASIVAKVARDAYMTEQSLVYPGYGFESHVGYGTEKHRSAIANLGVTPLHRLSFAPLKHYATKKPHISKKAVTTKQIGDSAEDIASNYLETEGHTILNCNWRTKWCEIDIVSELNGVIYFHEVKYRKNNDFGGGLAAITKTKQKQMKFAAELYASRHKAKFTQMFLTAVEVSGNPPAVQKLIIFS
jgi:ribonuclease HII